MQLKNAVLAAQFVNFCCYISIWLQNNCNNNYYAYIYLISHTKPYHDFGFVSINHAALRHASLYSAWTHGLLLETCRIKHGVMHIPEWLYCLNKLIYYWTYGLKKEMIRVSQLKPK